MKVGLVERSSSNSHLVIVWLAMVFFILSFTKGLIKVGYLLTAEVK